MSTVEGFKPNASMLCYQQSYYINAKLLAWATVEPVNSTNTTWWLKSESTGQFMTKTADRHQNKQKQEHSDIL